MSDKNTQNGMYIVQLKKSLYTIASKEQYSYIIAITSYLGIDVKTHHDYEILKEKLKWHYAYITIIVSHVTKLLYPQKDNYDVFNKEDFDAFIQPFVVDCE